MPANWCSAVEKTLSEARSPVHPVRPAGFRRMDFLDLTRQSGGFAVQDFRSQADSGFQRAPIEALPDSRLQAPPRWRPAMPAGAGAPATEHRAQDTALPSADAVPSAFDSNQAEAIRQAAFEEGRAQGLREGQAQAEARWQAQQASAGEQQAQAMRELLERINDAVLQLREAPDTLHEPLKRLALHLAEELVLAELQVGAEAIDRLVQRCIDELQAGQQADVCIELNPQDLERLQSQPELELDRPKAWRWQAHEHLLPGSVRVRVDDATVSDLIEHRLQSLAAALLGQPQRWSAQSALRSDSISARFGQASPVSDVQPRAASATSEEQDDTNA